MQRNTKRFIELDIARVIAIVLMISYHLVDDLQTFYGVDLGLYGLSWSLVEKLSAGLFLLLTGMCFRISWQSSPHYGKYVRRGARILLYALVISIVTYSFDPLTYVRFGILHLIAVTTLMLPMFIPFGKLNAPIGLLMIGLGLLIKKSTISTSLLIPIGLVPSGFGSIDYFPLFPWMGIILIGMVCDYHYGKNLTDQVASRGSENVLKRIITAISKQSLLIYMLHQPILFLLLRITLGKSL